MAPIAENVWIAFFEA